jgi:tetratricopeptide (TPR) repeat protein
MLAQAYSMGRRYSDADKEFANATSIDPKSSQVLSAWADSLTSRGERAKAFSLAKNYVANYPTVPNGYLVLGALELDAKQYGAAQADLEKTLKLDPKNMGAYLRLGKVFQEQGNTSEAIVRYKQALDEQPKFVPLITFIGNLYLDENNLEAAKSYYQKALAIDPNFPIASANLAWVYAQQDTNLNVALSLAQSAKQVMPDAPSITDTLAWVQYKKGLYSNAVSLLDSCVKKDPKSPVYHYHLGLALLKVGDKRRARVSLQEALRLSLSGDDAKDARQVLASLN